MPDSGPVSSMPVFRNASTEIRMNVAEAIMPTDTTLREGR